MVLVAFSTTIHEPATKPLNGPAEVPADPERDPRRPTSRFPQHGAQHRASRRSLNAPESRGDREPVLAETPVMAETSLLAGVRVLDLGIWRPAPFADATAGRHGRRSHEGRAARRRPDANVPDAVPLAQPTQASGRARLEESRTDWPPCSSSRRTVDVAIEGFRPGVADRLGVGYDGLRAVNPSIIYCSISGYGQNGPLVSTPGHDLNYQAWTGFLAARAPEINTSGVPVGDLAGGTYAALAICAAVAAAPPHRRRRSHRRQHGRRAC